ncbi:MAG: glycosyltransferase [Gemmatimonas sp.]|nr:glycosyltransferase [Gemmatimonas sp.]
MISNRSRAKLGGSIRVVNFLFDDRFGGPHRRVLEVAGKLSPRGIETVVSLPAGEGNAASILAAAGIAVRRVPTERIPKPRNPLRLLRWMLTFPRDVYRFSALLKQEAPEVVHLNGAFFLGPAIAARLLGIPVVWHLNDTVVPRRAAAILGRIVHHLAARIVVSAEAVAQHYGLAESQHDVIYAPVDVSRFGVVKATGNSGLQVGLIANWNPLKGIETFVRACAIVRQEVGEEFSSSLAGAKLETHREYARAIAELVETLNLATCITQHGFVDDVPGMLSDLDALVLSSNSEACPIAVLEGMAAGLPVVATDVGGVRELLLGDATAPAGILVPPRDPEAMAQAIIRLWKERALRSELGRNGRRRAEELFSLARCAERHEAVYRSAIGQRVTDARPHLAAPSES